MLVAEILKDKGDAVYAIGPDLPLGEACGELDRLRVGALMVCDGAETVAILMSRMTDRRIRHLPVLREGRLAGVISIGDVVKCQIAEATQEAESLRTYIAAG